MGQSAHHTGRRHQRRPEQNIRQIADRRVGKPSLEMGLLHRTAAPVNNREHGDRHDHALSPGSLKKVRSKAEICEPQDRKGSGFHNRHRMEQGRYRGRSHAGLGKPGVKGTDCRLHAKAQKRHDIDKKKRVGPLPDPFQIQRAAQNKIRGASIDRQENQTDKGKGRTAQGIIQIRSACQNRLPRERVHHERHRHQGEQLIEKIHGKHISRKGNPQRHPVGHGIKGKEGPFPLLPGHIFKGI